MSIDILDHASYINNYIINLIVKIIVSSTSDNSIYAKYNPVVSNIDPAVALQFYYNSDSNKCYIEFRFNNIFNENFNDQLSKIISRLQENIKISFKDDTTVWPELILISDRKRKVCDSNPKVTPFTIGYWHSLSGQDEFFSDQVKVLMDYSAMAAPEQSEDYNNAVQQIYQDYYLNDFDTFVAKMYQASLDFDAKFDKPPKKLFTDFIDLVEDLNNQYAQVLLDEESKENFINEYMDLITNHRTDPNYQTLVDNLYNSYGIKTELQKKVPEIFQYYKLIYSEFMEKDLKEIDVDYDHNDNKVEIWSYTGDFDFGDLDEGIDPGTVAIGDYNYNKSAEYIVLRTNYDILRRE